jgi:hypothetical protein
MPISKTLIWNLTLKATFSGLCHRVLKLCMFQNLSLGIIQDKQLCFCQVRQKTGPSILHKETRLSYIERPYTLSFEALMGT